MANIAPLLRRFKKDPLKILNPQRIERVCRAVGYAWRDRELSPAMTLGLFVRQILEGNCACSAVAHLAGATFTASAYCQARSRLPLVVYQRMAREVCEVALSMRPGVKRKGLGRHRTLLIDGTAFIMPDQGGLAQVYGTASGRAAGSSYPMAHLLLLFDAATGLLLEHVASPFNTSDLAASAGVQGHLKAGDIVLGDQAYGTYAHIAILQQKGVHGIFPVQHGRIVDFTPNRPHRIERQRHHRDPDPEQATALAQMPTSRFVRCLGYQDQLVNWFKPRQCPNWISQQAYDALPDSLLVRELRRDLCRAGRARGSLTMVSTLLDPQEYPAAQIRDLRLSRWDVETDIRHLKTQMGMSMLHCRTPQGLLKELTVFCLTYNLVRVVMLQAAKRQEVAVDRISFSDALHWMEHARPGDLFPKLMVNPLRPGRFEPRLIKRGFRRFPTMHQNRNLSRRMQKQRTFALT
jgi:hypothetical protein